MKTLTLMLALAISAAPLVGCGDDDSSDDMDMMGDGDGDSGDGDGDAGDGDGDGDSGDGDGDGDSGDGDGDGPGNIVEVAVAAGDFTTLAGLLVDTGLDDVLAGDGPFTVFAPTDAAFEAFEAANPGVLAALSVDEATAVLTYHVIGAEVLAGDLSDGGVAATVNGAPVLFDLSADPKIMAGEGTSAMITTTDIEASNGVIHVIDAVILPPSLNIVETAQANADFSDLVDAVVAAGLVDALSGDGPLTVFAPNNAAFAAFESDNPGVIAGLTTEQLGGVLTYHVVSGAVGSGDLTAGAVPTLNDGNSLDVNLDSGVVLDGEAEVIAANILTSNGVIHVIDYVVTP